MPIAFRPAVAADLDTILALLRDDPLGAQREGEDPAPYRAAFAAIDADPNQLLLVAEKGGRVLGCLQVTLIPGLSRGGMWRGQIEAVRVHRDARGAGLGAAMMRHAIAFCRDRGCGLVQLTTDRTRADALRFYERLGFEHSHNGLKLPL